MKIVPQTFIGAYKGYPKIGCEYMILEISALIVYKSNELLLDIRLACSLNFVNNNHEKIIKNTIPQWFICLYVGNKTDTEDIELK